MIWDKFAPFYDFFETVYNGKCYKGIAEKIKEYVNSKAPKKYKNCFVLDIKLLTGQTHIA